MLTAIHDHVKQLQSIHPTQLLNPPHHITSATSTPVAHFPLRFAPQITLQTEHLSSPPLHSTLFTLSQTPSLLPPPPSRPHALRPPQTRRLLPHLLRLRNDIPRMQHARYPPQDAQQHVDEQIGAAPTAQKHGHERHPDGEEVEQDGGLLRVRYACICGPPRDGDQENKGNRPTVDETFFSFAMAASI